MAARKPWDELSPAYRARLSRKGITEGNYNTPAADALRQAARGHAKTPERPSRASRNPTRYADYVRARTTIIRQVEARKAQIFGSGYYNANRASRHIQALPGGPNEGRGASLVLMRRFLTMTSDEAHAWASRAARNIDEDGDWSFLFYH